MAQKTEQSVQVVWQRISLTEGFSCVLFPLDTYDLLSRLPLLGYVVPDQVLRGTPEPNKPIATKGDAEVVINLAAKSIGIRGREVSKILEAFKELRQFYLEHLDPSPALETRFLEIEGNGWVKSKSNPTECFNGFWKTHAPLFQLGNILGQQCSNFGLELVPENKDPNDPNWFHIQIQPLVVSSHKRYRVRWIWREPEPESFLKKITRVNDTLQELILRIEAR